MAKVKCEYCGSFILDTDSVCPKCGAVNENHHRVADATPKTVSELKDWYIARNLPSEEVTRFFIGKNIKEPRAFGIYEENGTFTVYKNKADGSRAVRYEGTDEAYAVNELYLRLKEEILNQKQHNVEKRSHDFTNSASKPSSKKRKRISLKRILITLAAVVILPIVIISLLFPSWLSSESGYYVTESDEIFYCDGLIYNNQYEWWIFDTDSEKWSLHSTFDYSSQKPERLGKKPEVYDSYYDVAKALNIDPQKLYIQGSREYIDAGHHINPSSAYYYHDDNLYYFINDRNSYYGDYDNTGWYIFNTDSSNWEYYCDADDKDTIGDDLWYNDGSYYAGDTYKDIYSADKYLSTWNPSSFEDTSWYSSYEANEAAYQDHLEEEKNNKDNYDDDSDWDWDSNDSWDSGDTDWDSDW